MINLISLDEYKTAKDIRKDDKDEVISQLITDVSALIQNYINYKFYDSEETHTQVFDLDYDATELYLDDFPVNDITSITEINPYYYDSTIHFPVPETIYREDLKQGRLIRLNGTWPQGYSAVEVTYTVGSALDPATIPPDLKRATIDMVNYYMAEEWKDSKQMRGASLNNNTGSGNTNTSTTDFPPHIQRVLDLYL